MKLRIRHKISLLRRHVNNVSGYIYVVLLTLFMSQCVADSNVVYSEYVDISPDGWPADEYCEFVTARTDSTLFNDTGKRYDLLLSIRHNGDCPYSELFLPVLPFVDSCNLLPDTLHLRLDDGKGSWRGSHSVGIYTVTDTILKNVKLPPQFGLRLFHAMPCEKLPGLLSIGLIITTNNN